MEPIQLEKIFSTPRFDIVKTTFKETSVCNSFYYVQKPDAVGIIVRFKNKIYLVETFRPLLNGASFELFGGRMEDGEDSLSAAKRELAEELSATTERWQYLLSIYPLPSVTNECLHIFIADLNSLENTKLDGSEGLIRARLFNGTELKEMLRNHMIKGSADAYALMYYLSFYN